jgi:hypothetical protein
MVIAIAVCWTLRKRDRKRAKHTNTATGSHANSMEEGNGGAPMVYTSNPMRASQLAVPSSVGPRATPGGTQREWARRRAGSTHVGPVRVGNAQWDEYVDDKHHRKFWYNKKTGVSSWVDPRVGGGSSATITP